MEEQLQLKGLPVNKVYYSGQDPRVTHGLFEIANRSDEAVLATVEEVVVRNSSDQKPTDYHLYAMPEYEELSAEAFSIPPNSTLRFEVSFPFIRLVQGSTQSVHVSLVLRIDNRVLESASPVRFTLRTPK